MEAPRPQDAVEIVHLYAQDQWHSPAAISGSAEGLKRLRDAIDAALATGTGVARVMVDDGEGYAIAVMREGPQTMGEWSDHEAADRSRGLPYSDEIAGSPPTAEFWRRVDTVIGDGGARA